ncbi:MAG: hypothetical protein NTW86_15865, partial [Candidatus Sumerlaeota bacterium]|nr:hypothetical protein [Candidatus Sumerlaeota bacterium]
MPTHFPRLFRSRSLFVSRPIAPRPVARLSFALALALAAALSATAPAAEWASSPTLTLKQERPRQRV